MKRLSPDQPPYLSFCLIIRNCASTLEYTLKSIRDRAPDAEIVCVDTCSSDDSGLDIEIAKDAWSEKISDEEVATRLESVQLKLLFIEEWATLTWQEDPADEFKDIVVPAVRLRVRNHDGSKIPHSLWDETRDRVLKALDIPPIILTGISYGDSTVRIAEIYADVFEVYRGPRGDWNEEMVWFDDAATARQRSFELAHGTWRAWIDADDILPDPKEAERIVVKNERNKPGPPVDGKHSIDTEPKKLEDLLRWFEKEHPEIEAIWCPYLYHPDVEGNAIEWQDRERFIRNFDQSWHWAEAAHEVCVPKDPKHPVRQAYLSSLVFVHHRRWNAAGASFAIQRHWDVLLKKYEAGERNSRGCFYLESYSRLINPARREEFIRAMYEAATVPIDRYRALLKAGEYAAENGFLSDAMEAYQSAIYWRSDLPDAWFYGARALSDAGDHLKASSWFINGVNCQHGLMETSINPRDHVLKFRALAALELRKTVPALVNSGLSQAAIEALDNAATLMDRVWRSDALSKDDRWEASRLLNLIKNDRDGLRAMFALESVWRYLVQNDETQKAADLVRLIPHNLVDHPQAIAMEQWTKKVRRHLTDQKAYREFYNDDQATGWVPSDKMSPDGLTNVDERTKFIVDWLQTEEKRLPSTEVEALKVLEIGCLDGSTGIPILKACQTIRYTGVDIHKGSLQLFRDRAKKYLGDGADRVRLMESFDTETSTGDLFDAVVFLEVIEHVPDPVASIKNLLKFVAPGGRLFVSTPWGAFDRGFPDNMDKRDPRGHVRAMMPRDVVEAVEAAGGRVIEIFGNIGVFGTGADLKISIEKLPDAHKIIWLGERGGDLQPVPHQFRDRRPLAFVVPGALWDWNATKVINEGMGASEETIVYLARQFGRNERNVEVYGPLPHETLVEEEVRDGVKYWPREQLRKIPHDATVVISRAPNFGANLPQATGHQHDRILWLQDTDYDDLNLDTAKAYRKIIVLSEWHKNLVQSTTGIEAEKFQVINNFLLPEHFRLADPPKREPHHFIYASSPDRGLIDLLRIWPKIIERWPDATLDVFYGWRGCIRLAAMAAPGWVGAYRKIRTEYQALRYQKGINDRGMVSHDLIAREMMRASAWIYPTSFNETFCSNAIKARAAGCVPVTTPRAALIESADCAQTKWVYHPQQNGEQSDPPSPRGQYWVGSTNFEEYAEMFVQAVAAAIDTSEPERTMMSEEAIEKYKLDAIFPIWDKLLE